MISVSFPRLVIDPEYLYRKISFALGGLGYDVFSEAFQKISHPELVHDFTGLKNQTVQALKVQEVKKEVSILILMKQVEEKEQSVQAMAAKLAEKEHAMDELSAELAEKDTQLDQIINSKSWKIVLFFHGIISPF